MAERISLVEQYDNKDMIVQMKKCLDRTADAVTVSTEARDTAAASAAEAHTASTNANAASTQAQTAAATVATYETRLGAAEDGVAGNRSSIQTIDGEITDIYNDLTNVIRKVGDPGQIVYNGLELRGTNRAPNTTVGQLNDLIVNAKRLIEELNAYAPMVRTTGNQDKVGILKFVSSVGSNLLELKGTEADVNAATFQANIPRIIFADKNENIVAQILASIQADGRGQLQAYIRNANGTYKYVVLAQGDVA